MAAVCGYAVGLAFEEQAPVMGWGGSDVNWDRRVLKDKRGGVRVWDLHIADSAAQPCSPGARIKSAD